MDHLQELRLEIDDIDHQLTALFECRMNTVLEIAAYKQANSLPVSHPGREQQVLECCVEQLENKAFSQALTEWMKKTIALSCAEQNRFLASEKASPPMSSSTL